jgi:hypothetical protein
MLPSLPLSALYSPMMKIDLLAAAIVACMTCRTLALPQPSDLTVQPRQALDLDLIDQMPDPTRQPDETAGWDADAAVQSVIESIEGLPLPLLPEQINKRDLMIAGSAGYTDNIPLYNTAIDAPLDCHGKVCIPAPKPDGSDR